MIFFFLNSRLTARPIALKFCIAYRASFAQLLIQKGPGQVRLQIYDVIRGTVSDRPFKEIVFSVTELAAIGWKGDIMHVLGQQMTTSSAGHLL